MGQRGAVWGGAVGGGAMLGGTAWGAAVLGGVVGRRAVPSPFLAAPQANVSVIKLLIELWKPRLRARVLIILKLLRERRGIRTPATL